MNLILHRHRQVVVTILFTLFSLGLFYFFPVRSVVEETTAAVFFLLVIPLLYSKIVLRMPLTFMNVRWPTISGLSWSVLLGVSWLLLGCVMAFVIFFTPFLERYTLPVSVVDSFWFFSVYHLIFSALFVVLYEFFFRGFLMEVLRPMCSFWVLGIIPVLFVVYMFVFSELTWGTLPVVVASIFSTVIVYFTRSIYLGILFTIPFLLVFDAILLSFER